MNEVKINQLLLNSKIHCGLIFQISKFIFLLFAPFASSTEIIKGFNLVEGGGFIFDASINGRDKTPAQLAIDQAQRLGANHIILNVQASMKGPRANEVTAVIPPSGHRSQMQRIGRLISYIKAKNITVGLRTIFFVYGPDGEFPYVEKMPDGSYKVWWHGNIQPADPNRWFDSFKIYLDTYLTIARFNGVDEFTLGAELHSMTVGIHDDWPEHPYGFPGRWLALLRYARAKLGNHVRIMYDINFTDAVINMFGLPMPGGEFETWRYRLVDLANPRDPNENKIWQTLVSFWRELDAVGIDMYRSLASPQDVLPLEGNALVDLLKLRSNSFSVQMDTALREIAYTLGFEKNVIFKEIGFRSVEKGFIDPFNYALQGSVNVLHQAVAYQAIFESFWAPNWPWFKGLNFWQISLDPAHSGQADGGFSPVNKLLTESVIKKYW